MRSSPTAKGTVVVTGASTGIGRASALRLAAAGYEVFAGVRKAADAEDLLRDARGVLRPLYLDVTDDEQRAAAVDEVHSATGGRLTALVNNAGVSMTSPTEIISMDDVRWAFETNVFGPLALTQAFLPLLRAERGRLINIGSIGNRVVMPFASPLNASKWAFAAFNHALRVELVPWGIHVILIEPASIKTPAVDKLEGEGLEKLEKFGSEERALYEDAYRSMLTQAAMHIRRLGTPPEAVAKAVLRALVADKPKANYLVGKSARPLAAIVKWAPPRLYDRVRIAVFKLPKEFGARAGEPRG